MPVDPDTYERFVLAEQRAKTLGMSLMEVLDRAQLLLTRERLHRVKLETLLDLERRLGAQSPNKLLSYYYQRPDGTAGEMFEATRNWVTIVVSRFADNTLEEQ